MQVTIASNRVIITGNIKTISDFQEIKNSIDIAIQSSKSLTIEVLDSISMTSSVIGYFNMLIYEKKITLHLHIKSPELITLLEDLHLTQTFKVKQI